METELIKSLISTFGPGGVVIAALVWFIWKLGTKITELQDKAIKDQISAIQKDLTTLENKVEAVKQTLIDAGLWHKARTSQVINNNNNQPTENGGRT